jgi:hypothetical protein
MYQNYNYYPQQTQQQSYYPQPSYRMTSPVSGLKGRLVASFEEARAAAIDFDGSIFYFPDLANRRIYTKQIKIDGTATLNMYELKEIPMAMEAATTEAYITREEFDARLLEIVQKDCWIIDGNYLRTMELRLHACDTEILLDYPTEVCLAGAAARVGTVHEDLPWVEAVFDEEFRQWISGFRKEVLPKIYALLSKYENEKNILIFKTRAEADAYLNEV